jgi:anti-sigma B factor antagonist
MNVTEKIENKVLVLEIEGEIMGGSETDKFRKFIDKAIEDDNIMVVVDLAKVPWMNSSGLGMLISALTSLRSSSGDLRLANVSERLRRPLKITKLDTVFQQFDSVASAIASYN